MDWTEQAAGTFAMAGATEAQIHISRFKDLDSNSPERLVRIRGRHQKGADMVLKFQEQSLDYEHVLQGGGAGLPGIAATAIYVRNAGIRTQGTIAFDRS